MKPPSTLPPERPAAPQVPPAGSAATAACAACLLLALAGPGLARQAPPPEQVFDPEKMGLEVSPLSIEALGVSLHPPAGARITADQSREPVAVIISDSALPESWRIRIDRRPRSGPEQTPERFVKERIAQLQEAGTTFRVLSDEPLICDGIAGRLAYVDVTSTAETHVVAGWLVLPTDAASHLVFSIQATPEAFGTLGRVLAASFLTIKLRSDAELQLARRVRLNAGQTFLRSLTPAKLKTLIGHKQWYRVYQPADPESGRPEVERGYTLVQVDEGEPPGTLARGGEPRLGLRLRVEGRIVVAAERDDYYDSVSIMWMAWDQSEESWAINATRRQGQAERTEAETGVRGPPSPGDPVSPRGHLTVIKSEASRRTREPYEWSVPEVYLSQPLGWMLGRLMAQELAESVEMGSYFYNFTTDPPRLSERIDRWSPSADGSGNWVLRTRLSRDTPPSVTTYDADGHMIRRVWENGTITEASTREAILRLWRSKGLRTGRAGGR